MRDMIIAGLMGLMLGATLMHLANFIGEVCQAEISVPEEPKGDFGAIDRKGIGLNVTKCKIILISSQTSGSTWAASTLNMVPGVDFRGERMIKYSAAAHMSDDIWNNVTWTEYQADLEKALSGTAKCIGFKLMYSQIPPQLYGEFAKWLSENEIFVIHLKRRATILQLASSLQKAQRRKDGHDKVTHFTSQEDVRAINDSKVDILSSKYHRAIAWLENNQQEFSNYLYANAAGNAPYFEIWYELLDSRHKMKYFNSLLGFLGIQYTMSEDKSALIKVGGRICEDRVERLYGPMYGELEGLDSQVACTMLFNSYGNASESPKCYILPTIQKRCQWGPHPCIYT